MKYLNLWKYMNSPLLIENYSQGPLQAKLIFYIISFPHWNPKRQLILFSLKSMERTLCAGLLAEQPVPHLSTRRSPPPARLQEALILR